MNTIKLEGTITFDHNAKYTYEAFGACKDTLSEGLVDDVNDKMNELDKHSEKAEYILQLDLPLNVRLYLLCHVFRSIGEIESREHPFLQMLKQAGEME